MIRRFALLVWSSLLALMIIGCGDSGNADSAAAVSQSPQALTTAAQPGGGDALSDIEMEQGLGPVRDLTLAEVDPELAAEGESNFVLLCSACHKFSERYVGPPLGDVLARRRPEFVMNMMLNANEMVQRHPTVRALLAEYYTPMAQQALTPEQARAILEYIRTQQI